jgi:hypothetical protein
MRFCVTVCQNLACHWNIHTDYLTSAGLGRAEGDVEDLANRFELFSTTLYVYKDIRRTLNVTVF